MSPGSRSTPLVLSLAADDRLAVSSHIDERSGAFYALGVAKATGRPAVLACTSGTAAANYAPAVIEAYEARVPLVVLTADRPPELRDVGAGQTIDQVKLYGSAAKWYLEVDEHPATPERMRWLRQLACRAFWTSLDGRPGPVHLNFSLREPLVLDEPLQDRVDLPCRDALLLAGNRPPLDLQQAAVRITTQLASAFDERCMQRRGADEVVRAPALQGAVEGLELGENPSHAHDRVASVTRTTAMCRAPFGLDLDQHRADRDLVADFARELSDDARDGRFHLHGRLVGHHIGELLVFLDPVADLDVPGDDLGLGDAFADIGELEEIGRH